MFASEILAASERLGELLVARGQTVTTAESCTGGLIAGAITETAGSSNWFDGGFITYGNEVKQRVLGVRADTLASDGAVSERTVREMAESAVLRLPADWSIAVSGIAGPGGGAPGKPVGTVWLALGRREGGLAHTQAELRQFPGSRAEVRQATVGFALAWLIREIEEQAMVA
ncbi:CinA family protein [Verticiella sediminum]|uniref:CinA family protein n=1 Tax=Verticiella sediminum TaxID=1247510 RepID=A0A556AXC7_9BURK|nr:CinA family protein [Verticiella sediminum]TSH97598.1 CinA family protein [Verticiella sediminum]